MNARFAIDRFWFRCHDGAPGAAIALRRPIRAGHALLLAAGTAVALAGQPVLAQPSLQAIEALVEASAAPAEAAVIAAGLPATQQIADAAAAGSAASSPQTAADAALDMANMLDGAGGGVSNADLIAALEGAAAAGQPMALYRLGTMYENGDGVKKDLSKAFGYFSQIANEHADTAPRGFEADIVAQSFVKVGDYYREGLPDAGIKADTSRARALLLHAASYFGDADAQYRVGMLYLEESGLGVNPLQSARWLSLAARKGHARAQAQLGDMLFNGDGIEAQPVEGLMWLNLAHTHTVGTAEEAIIRRMLDSALSVATPAQRAEAHSLSESFAGRFGTR